MKAPVTASMLYDLVACPHRVTMDLFGDPARRDEPNPFIQLLWEKGSLFENEVIGALEIPFLDLSHYAGDEKERLTLEAIERGEPLIYGPRIQAEGLLGDPDLLRKEGAGYVAGDIKSGAGEEGPEDLSKPKKHYAVQLGLYTDILERKEISAGRRAFIWDVHGEEVIYDFTEVYGKRNPRTLWQDYEECLAEAQAIVEDRELTLPAYSGVCKLCHWYSACLERLSREDDLTLIPELGRSKRDVMRGELPTVHALANADPQAFVSGKKTAFPGIGPDTLERFHERAVLLTTKGAKPVLRAPVQFPAHDLELFFDIEVDPMRDICYLHGFVERRGQDNATEKFVAFFAEKPAPEEEKKAFADAWDYLQNKRPCSIYYYSKYERTIYRKLQQKYPDICTGDDIEDLFDPVHAVDLYYDVVKKATDWPTIDFSIKTLAKFLGFAWRDTHPSGAASIEWFDRWVKTGDPSIRQRILDYNEDDCIATRVLLDGIRNL
ncbi:MAG: TM0106 family RecB-like putative nuclease [Proteobacteria bacterium]|nr:TM0106 family RecB-like putative nuclease [Pseudomonadota bacterium]